MICHRTVVRPVIMNEEKKAPGSYLPDASLITVI